MVDGPYEVEEEPERDLSVLASAPEAGPRPAGPSAAQEAALVRLTEDEEMLEQALAGYLFEAMREGRLGHIIPEPGDAENDDELVLFSRLHRPEAMRELVQLNEIEILSDEEDGLARVVLSFESAFDGEHGLSVCIHGRRVLSHGGLGERGGWPPPDEEQLAQFAAMSGRGDPREKCLWRRLQLEETLADSQNSEAIRALTRAALEVVDDPNEQIEITVRIDTPPVTRVEKVYYGQAGSLSYDLTIGVGLDYVIYKDTNTPRQAGLQGAPWPLSLYAAQCQWPLARPQWETVKVRRIDQAASRRKAKPMGPEIPELRAAAEAALREGFDPQKLAARGWRLAVDPSELPYEGDPSAQEQALGAGMLQGMQALRGMLTGDRSAPPPPDLGLLMAAASGNSTQPGLFAGMVRECELVPIPADGWGWSDSERGVATEVVLQQVGLEVVGRFQLLIPFAPGFAAFVDAKRRFYVLVYDDVYQRNLTVECRSLYEDGNVFLVTTRRNSATEPSPAWRRVERMEANVEASAVVRQFLARRPGEGLRPATAAQFVADFKEVWRREVEWHANQRG